MQEIENQMTIDDLLKKLNESVKIVKKFRVAIKNSLEAIKRTYSYEDFCHEFINSSKLSDIAEKFNCKLILPIGSRNLTMQSNIDSSVKATVKLLYSNELINYIKEKK